MLRLYGNGARRHSRSEVSFDFDRAGINRVDSAHGVVTLASGMFQTLAVHDFYLSSFVLDDPGALQASGSDGDTGTSAAQHARQLIVSDGKGVPVGTVMAHQQP